MGVKKKKKDEGEAVVVPKKKIPYIRENWINIQFKLLNWKFMNFSMKFRETTHIFTLKKLLQERHGRIDDLKLCFHAYTEANEIHNDMLTLRDCGLKGQPIEPPEPEEGQEPPTEPVEMTIPTVQLFYDFKPTNFSDPVVLYFK